MVDKCETLIGVGASTRDERVVCRCVHCIIAEHDGKEANLHIVGKDDSIGEK
jgi:hypothetical protein